MVTTECECWKVGCKKLPTVFVKAVAQDNEIALCSEHGASVLGRVRKL